MACNIWIFSLYFRDEPPPPIKNKMRILLVLLGRKQHCRGDTWEEVVRAQLKSDWLVQLNAMIPSIPQLVRENNERDKKNHISDTSTLNNLIKKRQ